MSVKTHIPHVSHFIFDFLIHDEVIASSYLLPRNEAEKMTESEKEWDVLEGQPLNFFPDISCFVETDEKRVRFTAFLEKLLERGLFHFFLYSKDNKRLLELVLDYLNDNADIVYWLYTCCHDRKHGGSCINAMIERGLNKYFPDDDGDLFRPEDEEGSRADAGWRTRIRNAAGK